MKATVERKYVLTKIKAGDYLLPSNNGRTLWRLRTYEDGKSHGLENGPDVVTLWGVWKWERPISPDSLDTVDPDDWDRWEMVESWLPTRAEAVKAALRLGGSS